MNQIKLALFQTLKNKSSLGVFIVSACFLFTAFIAIHVFSEAGNTWKFQLQIFRTQDYILMLVLAILGGLNFALYWFASLQRKKQDVTQSAVGGITSGIAGVFGATVGTASCASCLVHVLVLIGLGTGSALFILENQTYFVLGSIILMLVLIYLVSRKINKICTSC